MCLLFHLDVTGIFPYKCATNILNEKIYIFLRTDVHAIKYLASLMELLTFL